MGIKTALENTNLDDIAQMLNNRELDEVVLKQQLLLNKDNEEITEMLFKLLQDEDSFVRKHAIIAVNFLIYSLAEKSEKQEAKDLIRGLIKYNNIEIEESNLEW